MPDWIDPRSLLDTVIIVSIVALAAVGFVVGMKQMIIDLDGSHKYRTSSIVVSEVHLFKRGRDVKER